MKMGNGNRNRSARTFRYMTEKLANQSLVYGLKENESI